MTSLGINLAERGLIPLPALRIGIRRLLAKRLLEAEKGPSVSAFSSQLKESTIALLPEKANEQHYEVPADFFELT